MREDPEERTVVERIDPLVGQLFSGRFRIVEKIAAGGFGAIYRAQYVASGHAVAIKVLHPSLAADPNVIARFRREGTTLSQLRAPTTVTTYEFGETPDGVLYIVMELLRGVSLHERLRTRGQLDWREALAIARSVCDSLAEAHELGIIHRDLKPANIQLVRRGDLEAVKVLDFGIAKIRRGAGMDDGAELTNAGQMVGTIDYMAPEQILGAAADGRCDLFTLGIVIFEMIAGRRPFADSVTPTSMLAALLTQTPPRVSSQVPVPPELDALVSQCLAREPHDRFASVHELAAAIDAILGDAVDDGETRQIDVSASIRPIIVDQEATMIAAEHYLPPRARPHRAATFASSSPPAPAVRPTPAVRPAPAVRPTPRAQPAPPAQPASAAPPAPPAAPPSSAPPAPSPRPAPPAPRAPRESAPPPRRAVQPLSGPRLPTPAPMPTPRHVPSNPPPIVGPPRSATVNPNAAQSPAAPTWQQYASTSTTDGRATQPQTPPVAPSFAQPERASQAIPASQRFAPTPFPPAQPFPPTPAPKTYDRNRDAVVGRIVWIVVLSIVAALALALYTFMT